MDKKLLERCSKKVNNEIEITWNELSNGTQYKNGESLRKAFSRYRKFNNNSVSKPENLNKIENIQILKDEKTKLRQLTREYSRLEALKDIIVDSVSNLNNITPILYNPNKTIKQSTSEKEGVLLLSDWHSDLTVDSYFNKYNKEIFEDRLNRIVEGCISHGIINGISKLHVCNLNDLVSGIIHVSIRASTNNDVVSQIMYISEKMSQILIKFSEFFNKVEFYNVIDNHSRVIANKNDSINKENFSRIIPWFIKERCKDNKDIRVNETIDDEIAKFYVAGHLCFATHGHNDKIDKAVSNLSLMLKEVPDYVFMGHLHKNFEDEVNDIDVILNPSLIGVDEHGKNIRKTSKNCQKFMIFNNEKRISTIYL